MKRIITLILATALLAPLPALAAKGGIVLNFNEVDISTMAKFISDLTGKNFIMDDRVKGKISVFSPAKLSTEEAFNVFTSVLELKGFTVVQSGRVYKIIPTAAARQSDLKILTERERGPVNDTYVARVITLENITAQEAVPFLQPVVSKDGYISAFGPGNMILLVDSALNTNKVLSILHLIDSDQPRQAPELVFLKHAAAEAVAGMVRDWVGGRGAKAPAGGQPQASSGVGVAVVPDTRLNALVIFGNDKDKGDIKQLIAMLDVVPPTTSSKINVYYLENADAVETAKVLDGVIKGSAAQPATPQGQGGAAPQQSPFEGGKITITPDKATNSLVIMASPTDYQNLLQVIQRLDKRRRQVFVQALIAEVSLDRLKELGVQWGFFGGASDGTVSTAALYDPQNTIAPLIGVLSQLSTGGISTGNNLGTAANFPAILHALSSNGAVNVLSTPNILTSDNKEAEFFVGENVPFRGKIDLTNANSNAFQSIERKDTGITLKITPSISEGEYVKLDIYQEISAVKNPNFTGAAADITTTKRSAKTSVVVKDQESVIIGGLIQDRDQEVIDKVPLLGDIPALGWLFKTKSITRQKINLVILLTPRVVKDARDLAEMTEQQKKKFNETSMTPLTIPPELQPGGTAGVSGSGGFCAPPQ